MAPPPALELVLDYARRGWSVFPVHTEDESGCSCGKANCDSPGKHPLTAHGLLDASTDETQIRAWQQMYPGCNWGVRTGVESAIFVVDADGAIGKQTLSTWEKEYGCDCLKTLRAKTPHDGEHLVFQYPFDLKTQGLEILNSTKKIAAGIDIRGVGGYVLVAPSRLRDGAYQWLGGGSERPDSERPGLAFAASGTRNQPGGNLTTARH